MRSLPEFGASSGADAVDLAASAGLFLDPWQAAVLEGALGERGDGRWAAFEVCLLIPRQNGKGSVLTARELAGLFLFGEELIIHTAHEFRTAKEAFRRLAHYVADTPDLNSRVKRYKHSNEDVGIELKSGQRIQFMARNKSAGRGFSADCVILDEAMFLDSDTIGAILPVLSAAPNAQLWYAGSAGMETSEHLPAVRARGIAGGDPNLAFFEHSAPDDADLDDREAWAQANPSLGMDREWALSEESIERERNASRGSEIQFARERLGIWASVGIGGLIDPLHWSRLADKDSQPVGTVALSLDVAPDRSWAAIGVAGRRADGLEHVEVVDHRPGSPDWVVARIEQIVEANKPCAVMIAGASPAAALVPALVERGIHPDVMAGTALAQACGGFYDSTVSGRLRHLDYTALNVAAAAVRKRDIGTDGAWKWWRKNESTDLTPLYAVTLARYGHAVHGLDALSIYDRRGMVTLERS